MFIYYSTNPNLEEAIYHYKSDATCNVQNTRNTFTLFNLILMLYLQRIIWINTPADFKKAHNAIMNSRMTILFALSILHKSILQKKCKWLLEAQYKVKWGNISTPYSIINCRTFFFYTLNSYFSFYG